MRFLSIGSQFTLHASFPHSVALVQLRFTSLVVTNSREDLHLQVRARAGRTKRIRSRLRATYPYSLETNFTLLEVVGVDAFDNV